MHVGMKKSPSAENGLEAIFYYAAKQYFAIIEISNMGYNLYAYQRRTCFPTLGSVCARASRAQGKRRIIHDFAPSCPLSCPPCSAPRPGKTTWQATGAALVGVAMLSFRFLLSL
jgi:hypothetical protein